MEYNRENLYNSDGFDINGIDRFGISDRTGEKDSRIEFAEKYIESGMTIDEFCRVAGVSYERGNRILHAMLSSPYIKEELEQAMNRSSKGLSKEGLELKRRLLSGEISITDVEGINDIIAACDDVERQNVRDLLIMGIKTHTIRILEYKRIFGLNEERGNLPRQIASKLLPMVTFAKRSKKSEVKKAGKAIKDEIERVSAYQSPFKESDLKRVGYIDKNNNTHWLDISGQRIEMAKKYLESQGEYICYKTMKDLFMGIVKGTLDERKLEMVEERDSKQNNEEEPVI